MRLIFLGASNFAVRALETLTASDHEVMAVVVPPAAPAGRGRQLRATPVEVAARAAGLPVLDPPDPNHPDFVGTLGALAPEVGVLVAFGSILRRALIELPPRGFVNIHPSLLPRWRGAAPIQRALMAGDTATGVSIIRMNEQIDAGAIIARDELAIGPDETAGEVSDRLAEAGAKLLLGVLDRLARGDLPATPQDPGLATPAPKIRLHDRTLDWRRPALELHNRIRALSPEPGATTVFRGRRLLVLRSRVTVAPGRADPAGTILLDQPGLVAQTGAGALELIEVQPEGRHRQSGRDFRNGARLVPGERLTGHDPASPTQ
jgi:methionyl-tRNA formyltransferase